MTEVHYLGGELSVSAMLNECTPDMKALAESSPDQNVHRMDEPYRRALTGVYARLAATLKELTGTEAARHAVAPQNPYKRSQEFAAELRTIEASLKANHGFCAGGRTPAPADPRGRCILASTWPRWTLRQSSDKHEEVVAELLATARIETNYSALDEAAKRTLLMGLLGDARALQVHGISYSAHTQSELAIFSAPKVMRERFGHEAIRHYIISHTETVSDLLEVLLLQKRSA